MSFFNPFDSTAFNKRTYSPDRWDHLSEDVLSLPGLYSNLLTFSAGPRVSAVEFLSASLINVFSHASGCVSP